MLFFARSNGALYCGHYAISTLDGKVRPIDISVGYLTLFRLFVPCPH